MSKKMKLSAVLLAAAFVSPAALAGGDGRPCFWKGGGHEDASRTVAESPVPEAEHAPAPNAAEAIVPEEHFVVRLDENGEPILPEAADAELPEAPDLAE